MIVTETECVCITVIGEYNRGIRQLILPIVVALDGWVQETRAKMDIIMVFLIWQPEAGLYIQSRNAIKEEKHEMS